MGGGEVLRISFGSDANAVSSHLVNLEGLACTRPQSDNDENECPFCDPNVTLTASDTKCFQPRSIFVDVQDSFGEVKTASFVEEDARQVWTGPAVELNVSQVQNQFSLQDTNEDQKKDETTKHSFDQFHATAQALAYTTFNSNQLNAYSSHQRYHSSNNANEDRYVNWDDMGEEDAEDEEDDDYEQRRRLLLNQKAQQERQHRQTLRQTMTQAWEETIASQNQKQTLINQSDTEMADAATCTEQKHNDTVYPEVNWRDYLLPPYPPPNFILPIASSSSFTQQTVPTSLDTVHSSFLSGYSPGSSSLGVPSTWQTDVLAESFRKVLEQCDLLRGLQLVVSDQGMFGGLATLFLEDQVLTECKSAAKFCVTINRNSESTQVSNRQIKPIFSSNTSSTARDSFRRGLNQGLTLSGLAQNCDLTLPLDLSLAAHGTTFANSAVLAAALESVTLPYRLLPNTSAAIAMAGGVGLGSFPTQSEDESFFSTYSSLNIREFMASLRGPSTKHTILELDVCDKNINDWKNDLYTGTTVNIDPREPPRRGQSLQVPTPGLWLINNLSSLSNSITEACVRSECHTQYSLEASFRFSSASSDVFQATPFQKQRFRNPLLQCVMEGIAAHTRPIGTFSACIVPQSFGQLTASGYGYWKQTPLFSKNADPCVVATLGNSTRIHSFLANKYYGLRNSLARFGGGGTRGYYSADVAAGLAPELDDCVEAVEYLKELDSIYCPPGDNNVFDGGDISD